MTDWINEYFTNFGPEFKSRIRAIPRAIVADAEKALVHFLSPKYNTEKYLRYPQSRDGINYVGFDGYSVAIADPITLITSTLAFRCDRDPELGRGSADAIVVESNRARVQPIGDARYSIARPKRDDGSDVMHVAFREDDRYIVIRGWL